MQPRGSCGRSDQGRQFRHQCGHFGHQRGTGDFVLPFLTPGPYNLEVDMKGFRKHLEQHIDVLADDKVTVNVKLELGSAVVASKSPPTHPWWTRLTHP